MLKCGNCWSVLYVYSLAFPRKSHEWDFSLCSSLLLEADSEVWQVIINVCMTNISVESQALIQPIVLETMFLSSFFCYMRLAGSHSLISVFRTGPF